jgi:hypothetical protein
MDLDRCTDPEPGLGPPTKFSKQLAFPDFIGPVDWCPDFDP